MFLNFLLMIPAAALLLASGCATLADPADAETPGGVAADKPQHTGLVSYARVDTRLPIAGSADGSLLETRMDVNAGEGLVAYQARYSVDSSEVLQGIARGRRKVDEVPDVLAIQSVEQHLSSAVPMPVGSPVRVDVRSRQDSRIGFGGRQKTDTATADVQWTAGPIDLSIDWRQPKTNLPASSPVDCSAAGTVRVPIPPTMPDSAFELLQRDCHFTAQGRGIDHAEMQTRGAAWRWGRDFGSALRIEVFDPRVPAHFAGGGSDYELGLTQQLMRFRGWQASADLAMRRITTGPSGADWARAWTADLQLRRRLPLFDVSARWAQAQGPLWFLASSVPETRSQITVALDFDTWLDAMLPRGHPNMDVSWQRRETGSGEADTSVNVQLKMSW